MTERIDSEGLVRAVRELLSEYELPLDRFVELGERDELEEPILRDLWLAVGDALPSAFIVGG